MRNRFTLIVGLAALVALAVPVSAALAGQAVTGPDGNTQSIEASVSPKALFSLAPFYHFNQATHQLWADADELRAWRALQTTSGVTNDR